MAQNGGAAEHLHVASITGVDMDLRIVGLGGRSYAFILDWHIRIAAAIAWYGASGLLLYGDLLPSQDDLGWPFFLVVGLPAVLVYVLYHPVLEIAMRGRTPGKRIAGVCIVSVDGQAPGAGALLIRNLLRLLDSLPSFYAVGLVAVLTTRRSVRVGDLAAGTLLVYEDAELESTAFETAAASADGRLGIEQTALARELLQRWRQLTPAVRRQLAARLLNVSAGIASEDDLKQRLEASIR